MQQINLLLSSIAVLVIAYVGLSFFEMEMVANYIRPFILPLVVIYFYKRGLRKADKFFYFLLLYAIGDFLGLIYNHPGIGETLDTILYFSCNLLYIGAYVALIMYILKSMPIQRVIRKYFFPLIILLILDVYCVFLVTDVAIQSEFLVSVYDYILEFIYNIVIMALLTVTLVNYLYRDGPKSMNLLIGALCVVFSEVIQVAYYYVSEVFILGIAYVILIVLAFVFFVFQANMDYSQTYTITMNDEKRSTIENAKV